MIALLMIAHGRHEATLAALASIGSLTADACLLVLDNASAEPFDFQVEESGSIAAGFTLIRSEENLGFAGGMNRLIADALADDDVDAVLLLNNDTLAGDRFVERMRATAGDMVAGRLLSADDPDQVDSLGITLYRSGLASNRKREDQRLLGPTGGCMLLSRRLLEDLREQHGYWFDERFFLYAEDTDLVMRARWLGYGCAYAGDAVALHHGSLSSGGPDNEFVLYHGIRNSIWALVKNAPALWLLAFSPWIVLAHGGIWLRQLRKGRARTLFRLYRDALRGLPAMWRDRRVIRRKRRVPARAWWGWVEPSLYESGYLRQAWRELFRRRPPGDDGAGGSAS